MLLTSVLLLAVVAAASGEAVFWEPVPFAEKAAAAAAAARTSAELARRRQVVARRLEALQRTEAKVGQEQLHCAEWLRDLERREQLLRCERAAFLQAWAAQETSMLHLIIFRLVRIQATAAIDDAEEPAPGSVQASLSGGKAEDREDGPALPHWQDVEVVACIHDSVRATIGEFPVHKILRASTSLTVTNVCDGEDAPAVGDVPALLRILLRFLRWRTATQDSIGRPTLYYVIVGSTNVFFNELPEFAVDGGRRSKRRVAAELAGRYDAAVARGLREIGPNAGGDMALEWPPPPVAATETPCGNAGTGGEGTCGAERGPPKLLAAGVAGAAEALESLVLGMLEAGPEAASVSPLEGLTARLRRVARSGIGFVLPDVDQALFGTLAETEDAAGFGQVPALDNFDRLHRAFFDRYYADGCLLRTVASDRVLPVLWHADGPAKWTFGLALDALSASCPYVARLVLQSQPVNLLEHLFEQFEATQQPGAVAKRPKQEAADG